MNFFKLKKRRLLNYCLLFVFLAVFQCQNIMAQSVVIEKVTLQVKKQPVESVFAEITRQTNLNFFYGETIVNKKILVTLDLKNVSLDSALGEITKQTGLFFKRENNTISVSLDKLADLTSQSRTTKISGLITDEKGDPVVGANIVQKGTTNGTITDIEGKYMIDVLKNAVIQVSYIGYITQEFVVGDKPVVNVKLVEDSQKLNEVVIVSYGTQKKRDITGSVSKIDAADLSDMPVGQFAQKLQGQVSGVQINQTSGLPGQGMAFRIRGAASINAGNDPLFVVDGMPISTPLNNINPDEIESFSVLKDAAATSLYGSRAANGVILITTKKGRKGKTDVSLNASFGIQTVPTNKKPDLMNAREFAQYQKERYEDKARYEGYTGAIPVDYQTPEQYGEGTDWFDTLTRTAPVQNYSLSISTGKDKFSSAIVLGYFRQDGVLYNTSFERFNLRANNDFQVNEKLRLGLNIAPIVQIYNNQGTDGYRSIIGAALCASPILSPYNEDGSWRPNLTAPDMFPQPNWLRVLKDKIDVTKVLSLLSTAYAELDIWNGIKYKFQAGIDLESRNARTFASSLVGGDAYSAPPQKAVGTFNTGFHYSWNVENMLMYNKTFAEHSVDALVGYSAQMFTWEGNSLSGTDFPDDDITWIDAAATKNGGSSMQQWSLVSLIGRLNYNFRDRYLLQATIRRDGCSRFGPGNKYANFPSVSAGWIISDESFMERVTNVMNYLKLRLSYGITGNYNIGNYSYLANVGSSNYVMNESLASGKSLSAIGNNKLTWEETKQFDLGVDFSFLNDRIFVMYDYYHKKTDGMLYQIDIPAATGYWNIQSNMGDFKSWGHEITINSKNMVKDFKWNTNFNISFNRNKVLRLGTNDTPVGGYGDRADFNRLQVGEPIGVFMGYVFDGVYMTQEEFDSQPKHATSDIGTVRMKDIDGNKIIDNRDRTIIGNPNPDFIFGLTNEFSYKNFDLSIHLAGAVGGDVMLWARENHDNIDGVFNVYKDIAGRWRSPENPGNGRVPRTKTGTTGLFFMTHSDWVYDGSYLAIKNVTLGYTIPFKVNPYVSKIRFYLTGQQLAVFSSYPGMNPEVSSGLNWNGLGVDRTTYPIPRTFSLGCNITF